MKVFDGFSAWLRSVNPSVLIGWCGLIVSLVTTALTLQRLGHDEWRDRMSLRPFVDVGRFGQNSPELGIYMTNDGVGPAIIKRIDIALDGKPVPDLHTLRKLYWAKVAKFENPDPESELRDFEFGGNNPFFRPTGGIDRQLIYTKHFMSKPAQKLLWTVMANATEIRVIYCSVYEDDCRVSCLNADETACGSKQIPGSEPPFPDRGLLARLFG